MFTLDTVKSKYSVLVFVLDMVTLLDSYNRQVMVLSDRRSMRDNVVAEIRMNFSDSYLNV